VSRRAAVAAIGLVLSLAGLVLALVEPGGASTAPPAELAGASLFVAKGCASCHVGPDTSSQVQAGPPLVNAAAWAGSREPGLDAAAYLARSIRDPGAFVSPARAGEAVMPVLAVTDDEVDRLVQYLLGR
jgi:mono/diheme cytochrome c family protein